jgi:hypothetical protein
MAPHQMLRVLMASGRLNNDPIRSTRHPLD